jgi:hypothetical protein
MNSTNTFPHDSKTASDIPQSATLFHEVRERINGVFSALEILKEKSPETQSTQEARAKTRLELQTLITDLEYRTSRTDIILGTKWEHEQFIREVTDLLQNP